MACMSGVDQVSNLNIWKKVGIVYRSHIAWIKGRGYYKERNRIWITFGIEELVFG